MKLTGGTVTKHQDEKGTYYTGGELVRCVYELPRWMRRYQPLEITAEDVIGRMEAK